MTQKNIKLDLPEDPLFPPETWGHVVQEFEDDTMRGQLYRAVEGLVLTVVCTKCGERREVLLDPDDADSMLRMVQAIADMRPDSHVCDVGMPEKLAHFAERMKHLVQETLAHGEDPIPSLIAMHPNGALSMVAMPNFEHSTRAQTFAVSQFAVRQMRRQGMDVDGIAAISLGWSMPHDEYGDHDGPIATHPHRREMAIIALVTPKIGGSIVGRVQRTGDPRADDGGPLDEGPGTVTEWHLSPLNPSRLVDGCFA